MKRFVTGRLLTERRDTSLRGPNSSRSRRAGAPMPVGFHPYPGGIFDNSPPFQRWVRRFRNLQVPKGRLKPRDQSAVPSGLSPVGRCFPNVETLGYYRMSLRDKESDTFSKSLPRSNPNGIEAGSLRSAVTDHLRLFEV